MLTISFCYGFFNTFHPCKFSHCNPSPFQFTYQIFTKLLIFLLFCCGERKDFRVEYWRTSSTPFVLIPGSHCSCQVEKRGRGVKGGRSRGSWSVRYFWMIADRTGKKGRYHLHVVKQKLDYKNLLPGRDLVKLTIKSTYSMPAYLRGKTYKWLPKYIKNCVCVWGGGLIFYFLFSYSWKKNTSKCTKLSTNGVISLRIGLCDFYCSGHFMSSSKF